MGLLDHVFKPQALTKPSEWAYTVEVVCLNAQPWWPIENHAPQVRMEGRRSANVHILGTIIYVFVFPLGSAQRLGIYSRKIRHIYLHTVGGCLPFVEIVALSAGRQNDWGVSGHSLKATQVRHMSSLMHELFIRPYDIYCIYEVLESGHTASPILLSSLPAHPSTNRSTIPHDGSGEEL